MNKVETNSKLKTHQHWKHLRKINVRQFIFLQCSTPLWLYDDNAFAVIIISQTQTMNFIIFPSIYDGSKPWAASRRDDVECLNIRWLTRSLGRPHAPPPPPAPPYLLQLQLLERTGPSCRDGVSLSLCVEMKPSRIKCEIAGNSQRRAASNWTLETGRGNSFMEHGAGSMEQLQQHLQQQLMAPNLVVAVSVAVAGTCLVARLLFHWIEQYPRKYLLRAACAVCV